MATLCRGHSSQEMVFEEGVDAYVPLVGGLAEVMSTTLYKLKSTMINVGSDTLEEFRKQAILTMVSEQSVVEAGTSTVFNSLAFKIRVVQIGDIKTKVTSY